jgi:hypothetical protein
LLSPPSMGCLHDCVIPTADGRACIG